MLPIYISRVIVILTLFHSTFGGLLHGGVGYSGISYSSPIIPNPLAATYSTRTRYTAYTAVPLTASLGVPALITRQHVGGLARGFPGPSFSRNFAFSNRLIRQGGVSAYAAVPIAGFRASFRVPSIRSYGTSLRSFPVASSDQDGIYTPSPVAGFGDYADIQLNDQRAFASFDNESPLSVW